MAMYAKLINMTGIMTSNFEEGKEYLIEDVIHLDGFLDTFYVLETAIVASCHFSVTYTK